MSDQAFKKVYLDNAATSWPKPPAMATAMAHFADHIGANPGRAGHQMAVHSARIVFETRQAIADLFNCEDPLRVTFTSNVTHAINLALFGLLGAGDHVITTSMEHNAVMRPLRYHESRGVALTVVPCSPQGYLDPSDVKKALRGNTRLIVITHASNVTGTIMPLAEVGALARQHGALLLLDAAQTAGVVPIDIHKDAIDLLAFTGHKSLYGPMGTGGLVIGSRVDINNFKPLIYGGTGSNSEKERQPSFFPDKFESGTLNVIGLAGLLASLKWLHSTDMNKIRAHEQVLSASLMEGMRAIAGLTIYGPHDQSHKVSPLSFSMSGLDNALVGDQLDKIYHIFCRVGLHCAPATAKTLGVFPQGTIRLSPGYFNQMDEIDHVISALKEMSKG